MKEINCGSTLSEKDFYWELEMERRRDELNSQVFPSMFFTDNLPGRVITKVPSSDPPPPRRKDMGYIPPPIPVQRQPWPVSTYSYSEPSMVRQLNDKTEALEKMVDEELGKRREAEKALEELKTRKTVEEEMRWFDNCIEVSQSFWEKWQVLRKNYILAIAALIAYDIIITVAALIK